MPDAVLTFQVPYSVAAHRGGRSRGAGDAWWVECRLLPEQHPRELAKGRRGLDAELFAEDIAR